jgi:hypothetical protein
MKVVVHQMHLSGGPKMVMGFVMLVVVITQKTKSNYSRGQRTHTPPMETRMTGKI